MVTGRTGFRRSRIIPFTSPQGTSTEQLLAIAQRMRDLRTARQAQPRIQAAATARPYSISQPTLAPAPYPRPEGELDPLYRGAPAPTGTFQLGGQTQEQWQEVLAAMTPGPKRDRLARAVTRAEPLFFLSPERQSPDELRQLFEQSPATQEFLSPLITGTESLEELRQRFEQSPVAGPRPSGQFSLLGGLETAFDPFDVFSQSLAEAFSGNIPTAFGEDGLRFRNPLEVGFLPEGYEASLAEFEARPEWEQIALGFLDPTIAVGGPRFATSLVRGAARGLQRGVLRGGIQEIGPTLPNAATVAERLTNPEFLATFTKTRRGREIFRSISTKAAYDPNDPVHQIDFAAGVYDDMVNDAVGVTLREVNSYGNAPILFDLNELGEIGIKEGLSRGQRLRGTAGRIVGQEVLPRTTGQRSPVGRTLQEVAQFPERYNLTVAQRTWISTTSAIIRRTEKYLISIGADKDDILGRVPGNYFPNFWQYLDSIALDRAKSVGSRVGGRAFYNNSRLHMDATEAIAKGYRGNPMEGLEMLFRSQYKRARDHELVKVAKTFSLTEVERRKLMDPSLVAERAEMANIMRGTREASRLVRSFTGTTTPAPGQLKRLRTVEGWQMAKRFAPDIAADLTAALRKRAPHTWEAASKRVQEKASARLKEVTEQMQAVEKRSRSLKQRARIQAHKGERRYPMTALAGRIFTPDEFVEQIFPESAISQIKTVPKASLDELSRILQPQTSAWQAITKKTSAMTSALRTGQAAFDLGVMMIHGLPVFFLNPEAWANSTVVSLRSMVDPTSFGTYLDRHWDTVLKLHNQNQLHGAGSDMVESLREGGLIQGALKTVGKAPIPGSGIPARVAGGIEEQFNTWLMVAKINLYEALEPMAMRSGSPKAATELAEMVAKLTGTVSMANLGIRPTAAQTLGSFLMFAPRYSMAVYGLMMDLTRVGGLKGDIALKAFGSMLVGGLAMYAAVAQMLEKEMNLDPRKANFLAFTVGDTTIGIGSRFVSTMRFLSSFASSAIEDPMEAVRFDKRDNDVQKFIRGQLSPLSGLGWNMAQGQNYFGDDTHGIEFFTQQLPDSVLPFWASGMLDNPKPGWGGVPAEFFGLRSFPLSLYQRAIREADIIAVDKYDKKWRDLTVQQRKKIRVENPSIEDKLVASNRQWAGRGDRVSLYRDILARYDEEEYQPAMDAAMADFEKTRRGRDFREQVKLISYRRRENREDIDAEFSDVIKLLKERGQEPDAHVEDLAYYDYIARIIAGDFETEDGEFSFREREKAIESFKADWGPAIFNHVMSTLDIGTPTLMKELYRGWDYMRGYQEAGIIILDQMGRADLTETWDNYMQDPPEIRESTLGIYPFFKDVERQQTKARQMARALNRQLDHFLFRFGYVETLLHPELIELGKTAVARTPVAFD